MTERERMALRLIEYRKRIGMSQVEFSKKLGKAQSVVCAWEKGQTSPDIKVCVKVCVNKKRPLGSSSKGSK